MVTPKLGVWQVSPTAEFDDTAIPGGSDAQAASASSVVAELRSVPRGERPAALWDRFVAGGLDGDELAAAAWSVWAPAVNPCWLLSVQRWRVMWHAAGYSEDGVRMPRPDGKPIRVFRGAAPGYERGLSWTVQHWVARAYREGSESCGVPAKVWMVDLPAGRVLARLRGPSLFSEHELVADVRGLEIKRCG